MRSPRKAIQERIRRLTAADADRYVDVACRVRVYRRGPDGSAVAGELLPWTFGGKYDTLSRRYVGTADVVHELKVHSGQVHTIEMIGTGKRHVLGIGPMGGGKTMGAVTTAAALSAWRCNGLGLMVVPIAQDIGTPWEKFLGIVEPFGWVEGEPAKGAAEIKLKNGVTVKFRGAAKQSESSKSPIAGLDAHWAVVEEEAYLTDADMREVNGRGRITKHYQIFSSATNEPIHAFQQRILRYEEDTEHSAVIRYSGPDNCFSPLEQWEAMKRDMSAEDYDRYVNCKDVPREGRVYPTFGYKESRRALPTSGDITARITHEKFNVQYEYIVGFDPGVTTTASVILKAFEAPGINERHWYVLDEVTSRDATTEFHARDLAKWFTSRSIPLTKVIVLGDPHENKDTDRSDYIQMRAGGFTAKPANGGETIERKHRVSMVNALLLDASGHRRLFLVPSPSGALQAERLAAGLGSLKYTHTGEIDFKHKTAWNLAHWPDALGYGLYNFERMRGGARPVSADKTSSTEPFWRKQRGS